MAGHVHKVAHGFRFTECPRWHDGQLYFADVHGNHVHRIDSEGNLHTVFEMDHPSGMGWLPNGDLLIVSSHVCKLYRYDGSELHQSADLSDRGLALLNDMVVSSTGNAYVGGIGLGLAEGKLPPVPIFRLAPDGEVSVAAEELYGPNGTVITPDGKTLIISESFASRLTAFDIADDGTLSNRRIWASFGGDPVVSVAALNDRSCIIPDGLALDASGAVWVADCRGGGVLRVAEGGEILDRVSFGDETVLASALGGRDRSTLYMMVGPGFARIPAILQGAERLYSVHCCQVDVPGAGLP